MTPEIAFEDQLRREKLREEFDAARIRAAREVIERFTELLERQGRASQTTFARKLVAAGVAVKRKHHAASEYERLKTLAEFLETATKAVFLAETLGLGPWESSDGGR